jgi:hypothetical protein
MQSFFVINSNKWYYDPVYKIKKGSLRNDFPNDPF